MIFFVPGADWPPCWSEVAGATETGDTTGGGGRGSQQQNTGVSTTWRCQQDGESNQEWIIQKNRIM